MTDFIEPRKNSELGINSVPFVEVEQPGAAPLLEQAKGFWVTFSTMFKKINSRQESAMARFIRLIICAAFSAVSVLKHVQHER